MRRLLVAVLALVLGTAAGRADDATAVVDKAIQALGGADKLGKITAFQFEAKGKISVQGNESDVVRKATFQNTDHMRQSSDMKFGDMAVQVVSVLAGEKGWRKFGDMAQALEGADLANQKRIAFLEVAPITVVPLKGKGVKVESDGEEMVDGKAAVKLKVTGTDGKAFHLSFAKDSGLPVKLSATILGFGGEDVKQDVTFGDYKEMAGIKKATKLEYWRDGQKFLALTVGEFKVLDKVDPKTFAEPE